MSFRLTILGSSSAVPTRDRQLSAHLLEKDGRSFLIDCAEGTQFQILKFNLKINKIEHIFISHLHGDHFYGIFGLLSSMSMLGREKDLHLYAPENLLSLIEMHLKAENRVLNFDLIFHSLNFDYPEIIFQDESLKISSFPLVHSVPVCGFRFDELYGDLNIKKEIVESMNIPFEWIVSIKKGADYKDSEGKVYPNNDLTYRAKEVSSYAYCSDTAYLPEIVTNLKDVKVLYHETTFLQPDLEKARLKKHSTTFEAAEIAKNANAKTLIAGHFSSRYMEHWMFEKEIKKIFKGEIILAEDGFELEF